MLILTICLLLGGFLIIHGITQRFDNLDDTWEAHEKKALNQGQTVTRTPDWDRQVRQKATGFVLLGVLIAGVGLVAGVLESRRPPVMSNVMIDGRRLTQEEWDLCGHDEDKCTKWFGKPTPTPRVPPTPTPEAQNTPLPEASDVPAKTQS